MNLTKITDLLAAYGTTWGIRIIGVLVALWIGARIARWLGNSLSRILNARHFDVTLSKFFSNLVRYALLTAVVVGCLGVFGIQTTTFAAVLAAAGLAVGLALQGTLSNFAAGVMLLVFRPFKVGDLVRVAGELGIIESIELFTTEVKTLDNRRLVIPNDAIFGKIIENLNAYEARRVDVPVGVTYSADIDQTRKVLESAAGAVQGKLNDPPPQIFLKALGSSSVDWEVRVWCPTGQYWDVYQDIIRTCKRSLEQANLSIPFPQLDVHFDASAAFLQGKGGVAKG